MKAVDLKYCLFVLCCNFTWIISTGGDKHPRGPIIGYYEPPKVQSYYRKETPKCPPVDPSAVPPGGLITDQPNINEGRPFYPCIYNFTGLEGKFFLANDTYFPCYRPTVHGVLKVGGTIPEELKIRKAVHQSIAVKFPSINNQSIPLISALVTEGFIVIANTTTPYKWKNNLAFSRAKEEKIRARKRDTQMYSKTQVDLAKTIYNTLRGLVENAERHMLAINKNGESRRTLGPFIVADMQTFTTPTTRALESLEDLHEDFIEAELVFGLGGSRFEFEDASVTSRKVEDLIRSSDVPTMNLGDLGVSPQDASRSTLDTFGNIIDLARVAQDDISRILAQETETINGASRFNFTRPPVKSAYCDRPIEIDPRGHVHGANMILSVGMGLITKR